MNKKKRHHYEWAIDEIDKDIIQGQYHYSRADIILFEND